MCRVLCCKLSSNEHTCIKKTVYNIVLGDHFVKHRMFLLFCCDFLKRTVKYSSHSVVGVPTGRHFRLLDFVNDLAI